MPPRATAAPGTARATTERPGASRGRPMPRESATPAPAPAPAPAPLGAHPRHEEALALFDAGHFFAAHEAWEELWRAARATRRGAGTTAPAADEQLLHALVKLAAAGVKVGERKLPAAQHHARAARALLAALAPDTIVRAGLARARLLAVADALARGELAALGTAEPGT
ncbi:MAG: DUF309 domain-containing protein [Polyangiaceae bacterium]|nr:DUF309 domain-containing protein [Polyangiaceae bacterium]